jgi:hypothetical protein
MLVAPNTLTTANRACRSCHPSVAARQQGVLLPRWPCPLLPQPGSTARSLGQGGRSCSGNTCKAGNDNVGTINTKAAVQDVAAFAVVHVSSLQSTAINWGLSRVRDWQLEHMVPGMIA